MENNNELVHYGVPGMKWGVRKSGYGGGATMLTRKRQLERDKKDLKKLENGGRISYMIGKKRQEARNKKDIEGLKKRIKVNEDSIKKSNKQKRKKILSDPTKLYKHRNEFSKEEIDKAMNKFNREQKLRGYSRDQQSYNKQNNKIAKGLAIAGGVVATAELVRKGQELTTHFIKSYDRYSFAKKYQQTSLFK